MRKIFLIPLVIFLFSTVVTKMAADDSMRLYMIANGLLRSKDTIGAIKQFEEAIKLYPNDKSLYARLKEIYETSGQFHDAEKAKGIMDMYEAAHKSYMASLAGTTNYVEINAKEEGKPTKDSVPQQQSAEPVQPATVLHETPTVPTVPESPVIPEVSATPVVQEAHTTPATPAAPATPVTSVTPAAPAADNKDNNNDLSDILNFINNGESIVPAPVVVQPVQELPKSDIAILYHKPYTLCDKDILSINDSSTMSKNYISTLFNHDTGRDMLAIHIVNGGKVDIDKNSDIEDAYKYIYAEKGKRAGQNTVTSATSPQACTFSVEYVFPDSILPNLDWQDVCKRMIGKYMWQKGMTSPLTQLAISDNEKGDTIHGGVLKIKYDYMLSLLQGILTGQQHITAERTFIVPVDSINTKEISFTLVNDTANILFFRAPVNYMLNRIDSAGVQDYADAVPFRQLQEEYDDYTKERDAMSNDEYDTNEVYTMVGDMARRHCPEAIYTMYIAAQCGMWNMKHSEAMHRKYKQNMIAIRKQLEPDITTNP